MSVLDDIIAILNNSKTPPELTPSDTLQSSDLIVFWNTSTSSMQAITHENLLTILTGEVKIDGLWYDTQGNTDRTAREVGNVFRGKPSADRYVVGEVLDPTDFDIDDKTKAKLYVDN